MLFLRESTAGQEIKLGPFVDSTDGNTQETALTIANTDIKLTKHGATTEANKNLGGATHVANGRYSAVLDATDTNTIGHLEVDVHVSGALAVHREYMVLPANVYDTIVLGTGDFFADQVWDALRANHATADTFGGDAVTPADLSAALFTVNSGQTYATAVAGSVVKEIADNAVGGGLDAAGVRAAVGLAAANLDTQLTAIDDFLDTEVAAIKAKTDNLPLDPADASDVAAAFAVTNGKVDAAKVVVDAIKVKTDALPLDPADQSLIIAATTAIETKVDTANTNITAIKAKTDPLTFGVTNVLNANITHINEIQIIGDGSVTPFNVP